MKHFATATMIGLLAGPVSAATLQITVTHQGQPDGFALTPLYSAFHDGNFDAFSAGSAASNGVETIAELGDFSALPPERLAASPGSTAGVVFGGTPAAPSPIFGGDTATLEISIDDPTQQRFFTFLSMVVPTNDLFIGNDDPTAIEIFDVGGLFLGEQVITLTGSDIYDAGTEVNDPAVGPAFVAGIDATLGGEEGGVVQAGFGELAQYAGLETVAGFTVDPNLAGILGDISDPSDFALATITISEVAPIPLPANAWLLISALGLGVAGSRWRKRA